MTIEQDADRGNYVTVSNRANAFTSAKIVVPEMLSGGKYTLTAKLKSSSQVLFACSQCMLKQETGGWLTVSAKSGPINDYEVVSNGTWVIMKQPLLFRQLSKQPEMRKFGFVQVTLTVVLMLRLMMLHLLQFTPIVS